MTEIVAEIAIEDQENVSVIEADQIQLDVKAEEDMNIPVDHVRILVLDLLEAAAEVKIVVITTKVMNLITTKDTHVITTINIDLLKKKGVAIKIEIEMNLIVIMKKKQVAITKI